MARPGIQEFVCTSVSSGYSHVTSVLKLARVKVPIENTGNQRNTKTGDGTKRRTSRNKINTETQTVMSCVSPKICIVFFC